MPGLDVVGMLFKSLLNLELKYLIFSFGQALRFDNSLINVDIVLSSPNFLRNCSSSVSKIAIDLVGNEKYQELTDPSNV